MVSGALVFKWGRKLLGTYFAQVKQPPETNFENGNVLKMGYDHPNVCSSLGGPWKLGFGTETPTWIAVFWVSLCLGFSGDFPMWGPAFCIWNSVNFRNGLEICDPQDSDFFR